MITQNDTYSLWLYGVVMPESCVYFFHDPIRRVIKIGSSRKLLKRFRALRHGIKTTHQGVFALRCLGIIPGGLKEERTIQKQWQTQRIGKSEWFRATVALHKFIQSLDPIRPYIKYDGRAENPFCPDRCLGCGARARRNHKCPPRCPCGAYTLHTAQVRRHKCEAAT